jgi:hypothetical protein
MDDSSPPKSVSRYAVFRELASGGMASVYYARLMGPSGFKRTVAVKRPHARLATEPDFAKMFIDEARVASRIHHPNVVATLDVIEAPDELGLVMDYVHGESLSRLAAAARKREERISLPIASAIVLDMLHGLHAAHEALDEDGRPLGIVHRDVSPQNVLVGADGVTRIVDFGIAKAAGRLHTTRDGAVKGKYAYMAPEQLKAQGVSARTDVYATSVVFWELLTGKALFRGANEGEEIYNSLEAVVPPPSSVHPDLPKVFDEIVLRGLDRDPDKRYPSARAMAIEIERAAPAVRPSEVAAWVQRLAGEALAARAAVIAEMEGSGKELVAVAAQRAAGRADVTTTSMGSRLRSDVESQVSNVGVVAEQSSGPMSARPRSGRRLVIATVALLLVAASYGARSFVRAPSSSASADAAPPLPGLARTVPSAEVAASAAPIPSASVAASAGIVDASAPPAASAKSSRPRRPADRRSCDPPFVIDSAGREIFKVQCL